jgi:hypothetical protein
MLALNTAVLDRNLERMRPGNADVAAAMTSSGLRTLVWCSFRSPAGVQSELGA